MLTRIFTAAGLLAYTGPAAALDCRLALVLAIDVSGSVGAVEDRLQRGGLAAALLAPEVERAFLEGGPVALYVFEWAGEASQVALLAGWQMIEGERDLVQAAAVIGQSRRTGFPHTEDGTALGAALIHASEAFAAGPDCRERIVDVSGDGVSNLGPEPEAVYRSYPFDGVTVNALVIDTPEEDPFLAARMGYDGELVKWFTSAVLHGPGSFFVLADDFEDYERAMTAKLLRELQLPLMSGWPVAEGPGA